MSENKPVKRFTASRQTEFQFGLVVTQGDVTPYGSASFINYVRWYGIARDALLQWRNLGFTDDLKGHIEIETSFCNIQYKQQAMLQDEIVVKANTSEIRDKDFNLLFTLIKRDDAVLVSLGKQRINFRDARSGEVLKLSDEFIQKTLKPIEVDEQSMMFEF